MTGRILQSCHRIKSAAKVELVQNGVLMNMKLGVLGENGVGEERRIPMPYLNILGRRDVEDGKKCCIVRHAKHCYRLSSQAQVFFPRVEGDVDRCEVLLEEDIEKKLGDPPS